MPERETRAEWIVTETLNMTQPVSLETRVANLEREMDRLKERVEMPSCAPQPWWEQVAGTFAKDPLFEKAMEYGRRYRKALRPKARKLANRS